MEVMGPIDMVGHNGGYHGLGGGKGVVLAACVNSSVGVLVY
jgi:hypothetical protein